MFQLELVATSVPDSYPSIPDMSAGTVAATAAATKGMFLWEDEDVHLAMDSSDEDAAGSEFSDDDDNVLNVRIRLSADCWVTLCCVLKACGCAVCTVVGFC